MRSYVSHSQQETEEIAAAFAKELEPGDVIAYKGFLGAGKTAFTRGLAKGLCIECEIASPTFALVHEYRGKEHSLFHFDMYRVNTLNDLYSTGYFDYLDENEIIAIEWSENIDGILDDNVITVSIAQIKPMGIEYENLREITIIGKRF